MRFSEQERRALPDVVESVNHLAAHFVFLLVGVVEDRFTFVSVGMEEIASIHSSRSALFVTKDEIDPLVQSSRHERGFQRFAHSRGEEPRTSFSPFRQNDGAHLVAVLFRTERNVVGVDEESLQFDLIWILCPQCRIDLQRNRCQKITAVRENHGRVDTERKCWDRFLDKLRRGGMRIFVAR